MSTAYIYALRDPRDGSVRYVGRTLHQKERLSEHCYTRNEKNLQKRQWIESLLAQNLKPTFEVLEVVSGIKPPFKHEVEKKWILHFAELGSPLVNIKGVVEP